MGKVEKSGLLLIGIRLLLATLVLGFLSILVFGRTIAPFVGGAFRALLGALWCYYLGRAFLRAWRRMKAEKRHREPWQVRRHLAAAVGLRLVALFAVITAGASSLFEDASHPTFVADHLASIVIASVVAILILLLARAVERGAWLAAAVAIFVPVTMLYSGLGLAVIVGIAGTGGSALVVVAFTGLLVASLAVCVLLIRAALAEPRRERNTSASTASSAPGGLG